ncbi:MAG TPA: hypothetical protein ENJ93_04590 [Chloroflexi bacterium]|nr:hypothetical protein [Chloroflexota bacterium]
MNEEREHILKMLQDDTISTEQAMELLDALEPSPGSPPPLSGDIVEPYEPPPNMNKYRRFWRSPFFIALGFLVFFGLWLYVIYQNNAGAITLGFVFVWSLFMLAFLAVALAFFSRRAAWLHVRVKEKDGRNINISLPLPLRLAQWSIHIAEHFVDEQTRGHLFMASQFITAAQETMREPGAEPLMIDVDDDDGDHVQVYIG